MRFVLFCLVLWAVVSGGCHKSNAAAPATDTATTVTLIARWNLVEDSTIFQGGATFFLVYHGVAGDYWDFKSDGVVYIREGVKLDTLGYSLLSDSTIIINSFGQFYDGVTYPSNIDTLTVHSAVIQSGTGLSNPGGISTRTLSLKR